MDSGRSRRRSIAAGCLIAAVLGWSTAAVAASVLTSAGNRAFWKGDYRRALKDYRRAASLNPLRREPREGERQVYAALLQRPALLSQETGLSFDEAAARHARLMGEVVESEPLLSDTWYGVGDFYASLKPENQRRGVYVMEEISPRAEENLQPEDILQMRALEVAIRLDPNGYYYRDLLGDIAWSLGLTGMAIPQYREALILAPDVGLHLFLTDPSLDPRLSAVALEGMAKSLEPPRSSQPERTYREMGWFQLSLQQYAGARESFRKAGEAAGGAANYYNLAAHAAGMEGKPEEAVVLFRRSLARDDLSSDDRFRAYLNLGLTLKDLGRLREAAGEIENALRIQPRDLRTLTELGQINESLGHLVEAEEFYGKASETAADRILPLVNLVSFYTRHGFWSRALDPARELQKLQPGEEIYRRQVQEIEREIARRARD